MTQGDTTCETEWYSYTEWAMGEDGVVVVHHETSPPKPQGITLEDLMARVARDAACASSPVG